MHKTNSILAGAGALCCGLAAVFLSACASRSPAADAGEASRLLLQVDQQFAAMSVERGAAQAFRHYLDAEALGLGHKQQPIRGREAIYNSMRDGNYTLNWTPEQAEVAASGELGYSWGRYVVTWPSAEGGVKTSHGKYLNVWRKQADGEWKVLVDMGNQNPAPDK